MKYDHNLIMRLIEAMDRKDLYYDNSGFYKGHEVINENISDLWELLVTNYVKLDKIKAGDRLVYNYELISRLNDSNRLHRSIEPELEIMRERMKKRVDLLWRYNIEERRLYSYKEMKVNYIMISMVE